MNIFSLFVFLRGLFLIPFKSCGLFVQFGALSMQPVAYQTLSAYIGTKDNGLNSILISVPYKYYTAAIRVINNSYMSKNRLAIKQISPPIK